MMLLEKDTVINYVHLDFVGKPSRKKVINDIRETLKRLKRNNYSRAIVDFRSLDIILPFSLKWYRRTWCPKAIKSGLQYVALIVPDNFMPINHLDKLNQIKSDESGITTKFFSSFEEAKLWLDSKETWPSYSPV